MHFGVTGGTGFIGSNLIKELLKQNHTITIFKTSDEKNTDRVKEVLSKVVIQPIDLENLNDVKNKLKNLDVIAHFSASANTQKGLHDSEIDFNKGILSTFNILESMRVNDIDKIIYPSAPAVYGFPYKIPITEDVGMLFPVSLYGAAKLSSEAMISAFCHLFNFQSWIFRLGNVVGKDMTRGVIVDLINKLKYNSHKVEILGNGEQKKDIIHIDDCISGILHLFNIEDKVINVFNLSSGTTISVNEIVTIIFDEMNLKNVEIKYTEGETGWKGDVPLIHFDISKSKKLGWSPKIPAQEAVRLTVHQMIENG